MNLLNLDPVAWGSIAAVGICVIIFIYLVIKVKALMNKDAEEHKKH